MFVRHVVKKSGLLRLRQDIRSGVLRKFASVDFNQSVPLSPQEWSRLIRQAEAQADCPYTFTTQEWLLVDELTQDSPVYLRKLIDRTPSSNSGRGEIIKSPNSAPWALVVLLFAKAVRTNLKPQSDTIHEKLNLLSKLTEIVRIGHSLHDKILNLIEDNTFSLIDDNFGDSIDVSNKVSLLMGDYFLSKALHILFEQIKCSEVSMSIISAIRDLSESKFIGTRDPQNVPLPSRPNPIPLNDFNTSNLPTPVDLNEAEKEWTHRNILNGASLLGRSCESAMVLLNQTKTMQIKSYQFGVHSALAWQAAAEIASLTSPSSEAFSLVGAPVLLALRIKPSLYDYIISGKRCADTVDYEGLRLDVSKTNAIAHTRRMCLNHAAQAKSILDEYIGSNVASRTLESLISVSL